MMGKFTDNELNQLFKHIFLTNSINQRPEEVYKLFQSLDQRQVMFCAKMGKLISIIWIMDFLHVQLEIVLTSQLFTTYFTRNTVLLAPLTMDCGHMLFKIFIV